MGYYWDELLPWRSPKEVVAVITYDKRRTRTIKTERYHMRSGETHVVSYADQTYDGVFKDFYGNKVIELNSDHIEAVEPIEETDVAYWTKAHRKVNVGATLDPEAKVEAIEDIPDGVGDMFSWPHGARFVALWEAYCDILGEDDVKDVHVSRAYAKRRDRLPRPLQYSRD